MNTPLKYLCLGRILPCLCLPENEVVHGNDEIIKYLKLKVCFYSFFSAMIKVSFNFFLKNVSLVSGNRLGGECRRAIEETNMRRPEDIRVRSLQQDKDCTGLRVVGYPEKFEKKPVLFPAYTGGFFWVFRDNQQP